MSPLSGGQSLLKTTCKAGSSSAADSSRGSKRRLNGTGHGQVQGPRAGLAALGPILLFSLALGFSAVWQFQDSPFFGLPIIDEEAYVSWASDIASGNWIGDKVFYQDPLYPYFLAALFAIFGKSYGLVRVVQVLLGSASIVFVYLAAKRVMGEKPAVLAAMVLALYGGLYYFELILVKATLALFMSALSCWLGVAAADAKTKKLPWVALGASLGLLALLRGNFQAVIPLVLVWAGWAAVGKTNLSRLAAPLFVALGVGLAIGPVTIRNLAVGGELIVTTSQAGANFYIGNNELADGRYVTLPFVRANPKWESADFEAEAEKRSGRELAPSEVSSFWFGEAFKWIRANPGDALRLLFVKARFMVHQYEVPDNHSFYLTRRYFAPALWLPFVGLGLLWGPALVGMMAACRRDRRVTYPALFALAYAASAVPFFIVSRYRLPAVPALAIFFSASVFWAAEKIGRKQYRPLLAALPLVIVFWAVGFAPTKHSSGSGAAEYYLVGNGYLKTGRPKEAIKWYDRALRRDSNHANAAKNRAIALSRAGAGRDEAIIAAIKRPGVGVDDLMEMAGSLEAGKRFGLAALAYERAADLDPGLFSARARLGYLYATRPEMRDLGRAIARLREALEIEPGHVDTMNALGNCYFMKGERDMAALWYKRVLEKDPGHAGARQNLRVLSDEGR